MDTREILNGRVLVVFQLMGERNGSVMELLRTSCIILAQRMREKIGEHDP